MFIRSLLSPKDPTPQIHPTIGNTHKTCPTRRNTLCLRRLIQLSITLIKSAPYVLTLSASPK